MIKNDDQKIKVIFKDDLTFEQQIALVEKVNNIFVDIATNYHVNKIKNDKKT